MVYIADEKYTLSFVSDRNRLSEISLSSKLIGYWIDGIKAPVNVAHKESYMDILTMTLPMKRLNLTKRHV